MTLDDFNKKIIRCIEFANKNRGPIFLNYYHKHTKKISLFDRRKKEDKFKAKRIYNELITKNYNTKQISSLQMLWETYGLSRDFENLVGSFFSDLDAANCMYAWIRIIFDEKPDTKIIENEITQSIIETRQKLMAGGIRSVSMAPWISIVPNYLIDKYENKFLELKERIKQQSLNKLQVAEKLKHKFSTIQNWSLKQNANLLLLWITFLDENKIYDLGETLQRNTDMMLISSKLLFPTTLSEHDWKHYLFAQEIVKNYNKVHIGEGAGKYNKCMYKPVSLLPYPKKYIESGINFIIAHPKTLQNIIVNLEGIKFGLNYFVNASECELPTNPEENKKIGFNFFEM